MGRSNVTSWKCMAEKIYILQRHKKEGFMYDHANALEEYVTMDRDDLMKDLQQIDDYNDTEDCAVWNFELATHLYGYRHTW